MPKGAGSYGSHRSTGLHLIVTSIASDLVDDCSALRLDKLVVNIVSEQK